MFVFITGHKLNNEEVTEALVVYFDWLLDNDLVDAMVPFAQFEQWFTELASRMALCKSHASDFDIDRVEDTQFKINEEFEVISPNAAKRDSLTEPDCVMQ